MAFLVSPGVNTSEIDLTTSVPAVGTSTGATVGFFRWGPANSIIQVSSETNLAETFFKPNGATAGSFLSAANFLAYGNDLRVVRVINKTAGANCSNNAVSNSSHYITIANDEEYFADAALYGNATGNAAISFAARYPGALGNSLKISVCPSSDAFTGWAYAAYFDAAPNTTPYGYTTANNTYVKDALHLVVVDEDGEISGRPGTVLEKYANLSKATDGKADDNSTIYYKEVLFRNSRYIHWLGHAAGSNTTNAWGQSISAVYGAGDKFHSPAGNTTVSLVNGADGVPGEGDVIGALDKLANKEVVDISLLFAGDCCVSANGSLNSGNIVNQFITVAGTRKDCVAFVSPPQANVVNTTGVATKIVNFRNGLAVAGGIEASYSVMDSGYKYQYDKYNDVYRYIPLNADIAGLCVRTDQQRDPWFSPAGVNRGQIRNLVKLAFNPTQGERDTLYKAGVNPVVSFPGEGTVLYGDKTLMASPSAFDRINVRRLFIVLEKAISRAAKASLFEFNDEFTRAQFVALVEPFLRDVQGRRGIYDFRVVCDESNNTPAVIDRNEFVGDIYIKPARSVNFIQLNFIAVRSGVAFEEIVGRF